MGVLYVCDEPSVGLHPVDDARLIGTLKGLRDLGNTVIIVEHDEAIMRSADYIVDLGPGAGEHGGHIVATGPVKSIIRARNSITGQYLGGRRSIPMPETRRTGSGKHIVVKGARPEQSQERHREGPPWDARLHHRRFRFRQEHPDLRDALQRSSRSSFTTPGIGPALLMKSSASKT